MSQILTGMLARSLALSQEVNLIGRDKASELCTTSRVDRLFVSELANGVLIRLRSWVSAVYLQFFRDTASSKIIERSDSIFRGGLSARLPVDFRATEFHQTSYSMREVVVLHSEVREGFSKEYAGTRRSSADDEA